MLNYRTLKCEMDGRLLIVRLNRPEFLNAYTVEMADELIDMLGRASEMDEVGAIIVTGEGKAFCAGMDLSTEGNVFGIDESKPLDMDYMRHKLGPPAVRDRLRDDGGRVTLSIFNCRKPVIAAINGAAVGVGATMTLAMDIRLASTRARMGFVFGRLGIVPEACSTWFLPRLVGMQQALEWTYAAELFDADEGHRAGLFRSVHEPDDLLDAAKALARKFVDGRSAVAIALTRQMMWRNSARAHPIEAHRVDSLAMYHTSMSDGKEGVAAFLEKRAPVFVSRASAMPPFYPWEDNQ